MSSKVEGLVLVDKPSGITSHDAVDQVRRALGTRKIGHSGTLDPLASGLLLMGVGRATRLLRFVGELAKVYEGTARLGIETTTLDAEGDVVRTCPVTASVDGVRDAMRSLIGETLQRPPAYSAVKVGGRKLYDAARKGQVLEAQARPIRVDAFELIEMNGVDVEFRVTCSSGTYVRVLVAEVGHALGCGAHLTRLRRNAIGPFDVANACPPADPGVPLPIERTVAHLPAVCLDREEAVAARHGRILGPAGLAGPYALIDAEGALVGVYVDDGAKARPLVVLAPLA